MTGDADRGMAGRREKPEDLFVKLCRAAKGALGRLCGLPGRQHSASTAGSGRKREMVIAAMVNKGSEQTSAWPVLFALQLTARPRGLPETADFVGPLPCSLSASRPVRADGIG